MAGGIYLRDGENLVEMNEEPYDSEGNLQQLLADYPNLLAGDQIDADDPRRWLLVKCEMGLGSSDSSGTRWSVDHLFLDQDGIPTIVEVKRSTNTQIRREIVGQILEYAANAVVYWPLEQIISDFKAQYRSDESQADKTLSRFLSEDQSPDEFWQSVETNLNAGRIRLVLVADRIPVELRRIVEFLNGQMDPADIFAVEVKQFVGGEQVALAPRLIGASEKKNIKRTGREKRQWDKGTHFAELERKAGKAEVKVAQAILEWALRMKLRVWWGQGKISGSFVPILDYNGAKHQLFAVWTDAKLEIYFYTYKNKPPFEAVSMRQELLRRLNEVPGIDIPEESINTGPSIQLSQLENLEALQSFLYVYEWFLEEVRKT